MDPTARAYLNIEIEESRYQQIKDPASLLPFERRWEPELPPEQRIPKRYGGMLGKSLLDSQVIPFARSPR